MYEGYKEVLWGALAGGSAEMNPSQDIKEKLKNTANNDE
jgi:hypothetical protein